MLYFWAGLGIVALCVELFNKGKLITLWFALAAFICAIISRTTSIEMQLCVFVIASAMLFFIIKPAATRLLNARYDSIWIKE